MLIITSSIVDVFVFVYAGWNYEDPHWLIWMCSQASWDLEDCERKVKWVGQQEPSLQGVCLWSVITLM